MDLVFFQSILVQPPVILGQRLRPLSAWHILALTAFKNPFIVGGEYGTSAVTQAVWICQTEFETGPSRLMDSRQLYHDCYAWASSLGDFDIVHAAEELQQYIDDYTNIPKIWKKQKSGGNSAIVLPLRVVATVLQKFPQISEADAWNMPFCRLMAYRACYAEDVGNDLIDDATRKVIQRIHELGLQESDEVIRGETEGIKPAGTKKAKKPRKPRRRQKKK